MTEAYLLLVWKVRTPLPHKAPKAVVISKLEISILIFQVNNIEIEYIQALIRFNSKPFEDYLKSLFELKKKIIDINEDDEDFPPT